MKTATLVLPAAFLLLAALVAAPGCGGDPSSPDPHGTVSVTVAPETLAAPWLLFGPDGYSHEGSGSERLSALAAGDYTLNWGNVDGWIRPQPASVSGALTAGGELSFAAVFREGASLVIEPLPVDLDAPWSVAGPEGYARDGIGPMVLENLDAGTYTVTWNERSGYDVPEPSVTVHELAEGEIVVVQGVYGARPGHLTIAPSQAGAVWTVVGPDGETTWNGSGEVEFAQIEPGVYTVSWEVEAGWLAPRPVEIVLPPDGAVVHVVDFIPTADLAVIPAGTFVMGNNSGDPDAEPGSEPDEFPEHIVTISRDFLMSTTEVTNEQFIPLLQWAYDQGFVDCDGLTVTSSDDAGILFVDLRIPQCEIGFAAGEFFLRDAGWGLQPRHPVTSVSWYGAARFCDWMNEYEGHPRSYGDDWLCNGNDPYGAAGYRLATEAEWEYACRAGSGGGFFAGDITNINCDDPVLDAIGWYCGNTDLPETPEEEIRPHPVAQLQVSPWGLYDTHGNLFEWVNDVSTPRYSSATVVDPVAPVDGSSRTVRGGTSATIELNKALNCRSANRSSRAASVGTNYIGIRVVRTVPSGSR